MGFGGLVVVVVLFLFCFVFNFNLFNLLEKGRPVWTTHVVRRLVLLKGETFPMDALSYSSLLCESMWQ